MAALVFWFVIVPLVPLLLLWILITVAIPSLFVKAAGAGSHQ